MDAFDFAMAAWCGAPGTGEAPACPVTSPPTAGTHCVHQPSAEPSFYSQKQTQKGECKGNRAEEVKWREPGCKISLAWDAEACFQPRCTSMRFNTSPTDQRGLWDKDLSHHTQQSANNTANGTKALCAQFRTV